MIAMQLFKTIKSSVLLKFSNSMIDGRCTLILGLCDRKGVTFDQSYVRWSMDRELGSSMID